MKGLPIAWIGVPAALVLGCSSEQIRGATDSWDDMPLDSTGDPLDVSHDPPVDSIASDVSPDSMADDATDGSVLRDIEFDPNEYDCSEEVTEADAAMGMAGSECLVNEHCLGITYSDPLCIKHAFGMPWPCGYCSRNCYETSDCHSDRADCARYSSDGIEFQGFCLKLCAVDGDCRDPEYSCVEDPFNRDVHERYCVPAGLSFDE